MTNKKSTLSLALGTVFVASMAASSVAGAAQNPFAMASLDKGYMVAEADMAKDGNMKPGKLKDSKMSDDKMKDGKCGEGKCGATKSTMKNSPGADKMKDGKCGSMKK